MKRRLLSLLFALVMCVCLLGSITCSAENSLTSQSETHYGLTLENGQVMLNDKPYRAMGMNFYDPFLVNLRGIQSDAAEVKAEFKQLHDSGIPLIRVSMCGFSWDEFRKYIEDPDFYFYCMDQVVAYAEQYEIGIIFDLCWWIDAIPAYVGEERISVGNVNSETMQVAKAYVADMVTRYKDSPAVWVWEIGNEYNLDCDLDCAVSRPAGQQLSADDVEVFYRELATVIRSIDSYRLITGGDSEPRNAAYNLWKYDRWITDSAQERAIAMRMFSPVPMNMMSIHLYQSQQGNGATGSVGMGDIENFDSRVKEYMSIAQAAGQTLLIGEFGIMEGVCTDRNVAQTLLRRQYDAIINNGVPLSCLWVFGKETINEDPMTVSPTNELSYQYDIVVEGNAYYRLMGLQDSAEYWKNAKAFANGVLYNGQAEKNGAGAAWILDASVGQAGKDSSVMHDGLPSLKLSAASTTTVDWNYWLRGGLVSAGDELTVSGYVKTEDLKITGSGLRILFGAVGLNYTVPVSGTRDWTRFETTLIVTKAATLSGNNLCYDMNGCSGTAWVQGLCIAKKLQPIQGNIVYSSVAETNFRSCSPWLLDESKGNCGIDFAVMHDGLPSIRLQAAEQNIVDVNYWFGSGTVKADSAVTVRGYVKTSGLTVSGAGVRILCNAIGLECNVPTQNTADWTYFEKTVTVMRDVELAGNNLCYDLNGAVGTAWLQGVTITSENVHVPEIITGWYTDPETGLVYYYNEDGTLNTETRISMGGKYYNFYPAKSTVNGVDVSYSYLVGWKKMPNKITRYYPDGDYWFLTGFQSVDGKKYFFNKTSGALYIPSPGVGGMGWYKAGSAYYALSPITGEWIVGLYTDTNGDTYYYKKYDTKSGYTTGLVDVDGVTYYFDPADGKMVKNATVDFGNHQLTFGADGALTKKVGVYNGYCYDENGDLYPASTLFAVGGDFYRSTTGGKLDSNYWKRTDPRDESKSLYLYKGKVLEGMVTIDYGVWTYNNQMEITSSGTYYFEGNTLNPSKGLITAENGLEYYFSTSTAKRYETAEYAYTNKTYYNFYKKGTVIDGVDYSYVHKVGLVTEDGKTRIYQDGTKGYVTNTTVTVGNTSYTVNADGEIVFSQPLY